MRSVACHDGVEHHLAVDEGFARGRRVQRGLHAPSRASSAVGTTTTTGRVFQRSASSGLSLADAACDRRRSKSGARANVTASPKQETQAGEFRWVHWTGFPGSGDRTGDRLRQMQKVRSGPSPVVRDLLWMIPARRERAVSAWAEDLVDDVDDATLEDHAATATPAVPRFSPVKTTSGRRCSWPQLLLGGVFSARRCPRPRCTSLSPNGRRHDLDRHT